MTSLATVEDDCFDHILSKIRHTSNQCLDAYAAPHPSATFNPLLSDEEQKRMKSSLNCCAPIAPGFSIPNLSQIVRDTNGPAVDTLVLRVFYSAYCVVFKTAID